MNFVDAARPDHGGGGRPGGGGPLNALAWERARDNRTLSGGSCDQAVLHLAPPLAGRAVSIRITGGELRGRLIQGVPEGVRPTAGRVREALFSMVGQALQGWSALDAFGGTGLLAFEAASRGAAPVTVVELRRPVARQIAARAEALGLQPPRLVVEVGDAAKVLGAGTWDLVLLDPPYAEDPAVWVARGAAATRRVLVMEHRAGADLPAQVGPLVLDRIRTYGDSALALYRAGALPGVEEAGEVGEDAGVIEGEG